MRRRSVATQARNIKMQARLGRPMDRRLKDYSLAAAGVGALALAAPAHASISATASNLNFSIPVNGGFTFLRVPGYPHTIGIGNTSSVAFSAGGAGIGFSTGASESASGAAFFGKAGHYPMVPATMSQRVPGSLARFSSGAGLVNNSPGGTDANFLGNNEYAGFSITKGGVTHYGWVSLSISRSGISYTVTVNQIAIENCPGQPITIGQTSGGATCGVPTTPAPNFLWLLSLGVARLAGLEALRRLRKTA